MALVCRTYYHVNVVEFSAVNHFGKYCVVLSDIVCLECYMYVLVPEIFESDKASRIEIYSSFGCGAYLLWNFTFFLVGKVTKVGASLERHQQCHCEIFLVGVDGCRIRLFGFQIVVFHRADIICLVIFCVVIVGVCNRTNCRSVSFACCLFARYAYCFAY